MAGLEVVVRPVVFPNIRPAPTRSLPPQDDPEKGFAVIRGNGAKQVSLSNSYSSSARTANQTETKRRVDTARVYQKNDDGTVNKENFVDIDVANKVWMKGPSGDRAGFNGDDLVSTVPGKGFTGDDVVPKSSEGGKANDVRVRHYRPVEEKDNIEIKKRNLILEKGQSSA